MATLALIQQAVSDQAADAAATAAKTAADSAATASAQALHDDLKANGPAVTVDTTQTPAVVVEYSAVDPGSFASAPLRVAT